MLTIMLALLMPSSFAVGFDTGFELVVMVNNEYYDFADGHYLLDFDGIYFEPSIYKNLFGIELTEQGDEWVVSKAGKTLGKIAKDDKAESGGEEIDALSFSEKDEAYVSLEKVNSFLGDGFNFSWEVLRNPKTDYGDYKLINISASEEFYKPEKLKTVNMSMPIKSIDKMRNTQAYIKKMTKNKPKVDKVNNTITYKDKSCEVIISLNGNENLNVAFTGKLSADAIGIINVAISDSCSKTGAKEAVTEIKRLDTILMNQKGQKKEFDELKNREYNPWYYFGSERSFKWSYDMTNVQGKNYIDFYVTNFFLDTSDYDN
jgi:hypothetical protein